MRALGEELTQLNALKELNVSFSRCSGLVDVRALGGQGLAQLKALTHLNIFGLVDVSAVGEGLAQLKYLQHLTAIKSQKDILHDEMGDFMDLLGDFEEFNEEFGDDGEWMKELEAEIETHKMKQPRSIVTFIHGRYAYTNHDCQPSPSRLFHLFHSKWF